MTTLLTDNLPLLAGAPNGIKKLRELILELAVRGKLVPQDSSDEPASELLKRIAAAKARLVAEGKIKKSKSEEYDAVELAYSIPTNWAVACLGQVVEIVRGITFPASEKSRTPEPGRVACLRTANVQDEIEWDDLLFIRESFVSRADQYVQPHDIVMSMANSRELVGKVALIGAELAQKTSFGGFLGVLRPVFIEPRFIMALLRTPNARSALIDSSSQTTNIANVSLAKLRPLPFAIPPLAEQHRIVAKVDELMALCDRLEAQQAEAESAHAQLVQALLGSLTQASDAADFVANWQRLAEHFHTLFTTEPSIDALKQSLLQLAVIGKLVPQAPSNEPASSYYRRQLELPKDCVRSGKQKIKENALTGAKDLPSIPESWTYKSIDELYQSCHIFDYADGNHGSFYPRKDEFSDEGVVFLTAAQITADGTILWHECPRLAPAKAMQLTKGWSELGDVFYTHNATVGRTAISREGPQNKFLLGTSVTFYRVNDGGINPSFLYWYFSSRSWSDQAQLVMRQTTRNQVSITKQALFFVALPPLPEQNRIVAKVDQLMALCDQLKARLTQARQLNEQLASTLVEQAVA